IFEEPRPDQLRLRRRRHPHQHRSQHHLLQVPIHQHRCIHPEHDESDDPGGPDVRIPSRGLLQLPSWSWRLLQLP
uniref:Uncharacterized protein n=1 Tax=Triticum urartu TaxID=4572 RepID=A0A8R7TAU3_TRIUA